ncbi:hypothetical protein AAKU67_003206 [Oxalobacteraceae bacterium GrIS 2.11]
MDITNYRNPLLPVRQTGQIGPDDLLTEAPAPNCLNRASKNLLAGLGSGATKYLGGILIGTGVIASSATGIGLGLMIAGSSVLALSTAQSTSALDDRSCYPVFRHLGSSLLTGAGGVFMGVTSESIISVATNLPIYAHPPITVATSVVLSAILCGCRVRCCRSTEAPPVSIEKEVNVLLKKHFRSVEELTFNVKNRFGIYEEMVFSMERGQDMISMNSIKESENEWIAVQRNPGSSQYDLFEASSFYLNRNTPRFETHPYNRANMSNITIIRGQRLLDLLKAAPTPRQQPKADVALLDHNRFEKPGYLV